MERWQRAQWRGLFGRPLLTAGVIGAVAAINATISFRVTILGLRYLVGFNTNYPRPVLMMRAIADPMPLFTCWACLQLLTTEVRQGRRTDFQMSLLSSRDLFFAKMVPLSLWMTGVVAVGAIGGNVARAWMAGDFRWLPPFSWGIWVDSILTRGLGPALSLGVAGPALVAASLCHAPHRRRRIEAVLVPAFLLMVLHPASYWLTGVTMSYPHPDDPVWRLVLTIWWGRAFLHRLWMTALLAALAWIYAAPRFKTLYEEE